MNKKKNRTRFSSHFFGNLAFKIVILLTRFGPVLLFYTAANANAVCLKLTAK